MLSIAAVALGLSLTACNNGADGASSSVTGSSVSSTSPAQSGTSGTSSSKTGSTAPSGTAKKSGVSCTNQIDYAGDPRSNAEINSIGADTGICPPIQKG